MSIYEFIFRSIERDFMDTFFITYRLFCSSTCLLDLLIERFKVPTPRRVYRAFERMSSEKAESLYYQFRDKYKHPIQKRLSIFFTFQNIQKSFNLIECYNQFTFGRVIISVISTKMRIFYIN